MAERFQNPSNTGLLKKRRTSRAAILRNTVVNSKVEPLLTETLLPTEIIEEREEEEELDDDDYMPDFIRSLLERLPLLPNETEAEFMQVFCSFEYMGTSRAKTVGEYVLVYSITLLTWEVIRYARMKIALMLNQQRSAVEAMFRKTHEGAAMEGAASGLRIAGNQSANGWFADPASRAQSAKNFEAAGFAPNAVEADAFMRALPSLATIERLMESAQKRLMAFLKDLEKRYGSRADEMRVTSMQAIVRATRPQQSENG